VIYQVKKNQWSISTPNKKNLLIKHLRQIAKIPHSQNRQRFLKEIISINSTNLLCTSLKMSIKKKLAYLPNSFNVILNYSMTYVPSLVKLYSTSKSLEDWEVLPITLEFRQLNHTLLLALETLKSFSINYLTKIFTYVLKKMDGFGQRRKT
jgi:hypothetical protein